MPFDLVEKHIAEFDELFRTPEAHGTGNLRNWVFSMAQMHENPQIELIHAWNVMNSIVRGTIGKLSDLGKTGSQT